MNPDSWKSTTKSTMRRCSIWSYRLFFASTAVSAMKSPWTSMTQTWLYSSHLIAMDLLPHALSAG
jgi:hypothetical protein